MGYTTLICITALFLSTFSCGSSHKKTTAKNATDSLKKSMVHNDTIPKPPSVLPGLPPNTARVKGMALRIHRIDNDKATIQFIVLNILGTGASTPLLTPNDTLLVKTGALPDSLKEGVAFVSMLRHRQVLAQFKKTAPQWQLLKIESNQDQK